MEIVTIPDGVTGPALNTVQVINAKWTNAQEWFQKAFDFGGGVKADIGVAPHIGEVDLATALSMISPPTDLKFDDPDSAMAQFDAKNAELTAIVNDAFNKMLGIAFPDMTLLADAIQWCKRAINQGGTGINPAVETALWERARARIVKQADRDTISAQEKYARAGWPLPPGAMLHETAMIRQDSRDKLADQNREISIKSFDTEVENIRFAVTTAGDLFTKALQAVGDYVRTVMLAPQLAAQLTTQLSGLKGEAARTLVALYQAQSAALDPFLRMEITDDELKTRVREANLRADMETNQMRAQAALSNLKMVGDAAAASLNGIGSGVGNTVTTSISE